MTRASTDARPPASLDRPDPVVGAVAGERPNLVVSLIVGAVVAVGLFVVGFSGGSYDLVDRQTAAVVIWWVVGLGALVVAPGPRRPGTAGVLVTVFAALICVWIAVDLSHSISKERTVTELARDVTHLGPVVLIGWVLPAKYWRAVFGGLLAAGVGIVFVSLITRLDPGSLGQASSNVFGDATNTRLAIPFGYWNAIGSWCVMTIVMLLATSAHSPRWFVRSLTLALVPVAATVAYMTYSRSSIGAMALGLVVLFIVARNRWTTVLYIAAGAAGSAVAIAAVHGQKAIADGTGGTGSGAVVGALVITGVVLAVVAALTGRLGVDRIRLPLRIARVVAVLSLIGAIVGGIGLVNAYGHKAWHQFENTNSGDGVSPTARLTSLNGTRIVQWRVALKSYRANKLHGTGAGTFEITNNIHNDDGEFVRNAHNAFIEALAEQGWPGLVLLVGMLLSIVAAIGVATKRAGSVALDRGLIAGAAAAMAAFTLGTGVDWFWQVTALALMMMGLAGVMVAAGTDLRDRQLAAAPEVAERDRQLAAAPDGAEPDHEIGSDDIDPDVVELPAPRPAAAPRRRTWPLRVVLVVAAVVAVLVELPGLVGTSDVRRSQQAVDAGNLDEARSRADQAIDTMPWASSPFLQRALVDEQAGQWDSAIDAAHLAMKRDPEDWRIPLVLSRIEAEAGNVPAALAAYRTAKSLRPYGAFFR